jgi:bifunctional non-homologous end joining protein LigD
MTTPLHAMACVLFFQAGTSDKEYHLAIEPSGNAWLVNALYGKRGGNLKPASKTAAPVDYGTAVKVYERVKNEKLSEGYRESAAQVASRAPMPETAPAQRVEVELLTPIEMPEIGRYIVDDRYGFQEKADGDRSPVRRDGNSFVRYNRKGEPKPLSSDVAASLVQSRSTSWLMDGEIEGAEFWGFSALEFDGQDLRSQPFRVRHRIAETIFSTIATSCARAAPCNGARVRLLPVITGEEAKEAFVRQMIAENAEGVVVVDLEARHRPGRAGQHFKLKFVATATVRVLRHNVEGKRSVDIELLDAQGKWVPFSSVSIPAKYGALPEPGTLIEVRYLYAHRGNGCGSLNQPVYLRVRDDLDDSAATVAQLKFKRGEE